MPRFRLTSRAARGGLAALVLSLALAAAPAARSETDLGPVRLSGHVSAGGRTITGDFRSAEFNEYRSLRPGFWTEGFLQLEDSERRHYLETLFDFVDEDDQTYHVRAGRWGWWGLELDLLRYPHRFSENALSPYWSSGDGVLSLPGGWPRTSPLRTRALEQFSQPRDLEMRVYDGHAGAHWKVRPDLELHADYRIMDRRGSKPLSSGWGFTNFANFPAPIDERIHEVTGGITASAWGWNFDVDYTGSFYRNDLDSWTLDNPLVGFDSMMNSSRLQLSAPPENQAHTGTVSASRSFELPFPVYVATTFSYSRRSQDDDFLPYTINSALPDAVFRGSLDGAVNTWLGDVRITARPTDRLRVRARYRVYDYDNRTSVLEDIPFAPRDIADDPATSHPHSYRRQTTELEASLRLGHGLTLEGGYEWEGWLRDREQIRHWTDEHRVHGKLDWRAHRRAWARLSYEYAVRRGDTLELPEVEFDRLRPFYLADFVQNRVDLLVQVDPCDRFGVTLNGGFRKTDYDHTTYGAYEERAWNAGLEASWQASERVTFSTWYMADYGRVLQRSRNRGPTMLDVSDFDWISRPREQAHNVGADVTVEILPGRLSAVLGYDWQWAVAETPATGELAGAVDFPDIEDDFHSLRLQLDYRLTERLSVLAGYRYEMGSFSNFQHDDVALRTPLENNIYLFDRVDDYDAHILSGGLRLEF